MPDSASSRAADNPAGPPPIMRHCVFTVGVGPVSGRVSQAGRTGLPLQLYSAMFSLTGVMHPFTGIPSAMIMHWEH